MKISEFLLDKSTMTLNESQLSFNKAVEVLKYDCKPFLKDFIPIYKSTGDFMYSGITGFPKITIKPVRKNRKPKDTHPELHKYFDKKLEEKFGFKARSNSLFCSFDTSVAAEYGTIYIIFPIGDYKYIWSKKIFDLYRYVEDFYIVPDEQFLYDAYSVNHLTNKYIDDVISDFVFKKIYIQKDYLHKELANTMVRYLKKQIKEQNEAYLSKAVNSYQNNDISTAARQYPNHEIMINCDKFIAFQYLTQSDRLKTFIDNLIQTRGL